MLSLKSALEATHNHCSLLQKMASFELGDCVRQVVMLIDCFERHATSMSWRHVMQILDFASNLGELMTSFGYGLAVSAGALVATKNELVRAREVCHKAT